MNSDNNVYLISNNEINRRKEAFTRLIISFILSIIITLADYWLSMPIFFLYCIITLAVILFIFRMLIFKSFRSFSQIRILVTEYYLVRISRKIHEKYLFKDIEAIRIKRTTKGTIREIKVKLYTKDSLYINALENFEEFVQKLKIGIGKNISLSEFKEPIDFDHPWFYIIFGCITGLTLTTAMRIICVLNDRSIKWLNLAFFCCIVILGVYWLFNRPISKRYGIKTQMVDFLLGSLMVCAGIILIYIRFHF